MVRTALIILGLAVAAVVLIVLAAFVKEEIEADW